jgi:predicted DNA binding CopG/RHH family protein
MMKKTKLEKFYLMFPKVGDNYTVQEVLEETGYLKLEVLKVIMNKFRDKEYLPKDMIINLRLSKGIIKRFKID